MAEFHCEWVRKSESRFPDLNGFPVLSETQVVIHELLNTAPVDLCSLSEAVMSDMGLSARVLWMALLESEAGVQYPSLEECIVLLGASALRDIVEHSPTVSLSLERSREVRELAEHSRNVAALSRTIAVLCKYPEPIHAFWAGLFHDLWRLPSLLGIPYGAKHVGWPDRATAAEAAERLRVQALLQEGIDDSAACSADDPLLAAIVGLADELEPEERGAADVRACLRYLRADRRSTWGAPVLESVC